MFKQGREGGSRVRINMLFPVSLRPAAPSPLCCVSRREMERGCLWCGWEGAVRGNLCHFATSPCAYCLVFTDNAEYHLDLMFVTVCAFKTGSVFFGLFVHPSEISNKLRHWAPDETLSMIRAVISSCSTGRQSKKEPKVCVCF